MRQLHAFLFVTDMRRSVDFYKTVLRSQPVYQSDDWSEFRVGQATLGLHRWGGGAAPASTGVKLFLEVDDLDAEKCRLEAAGVRLRGEIEELPNGGRLLDFEDPDGHVLQLWQPGRR